MTESDRIKHIGIKIVKLYLERSWLMSKEAHPSGFYRQLI